MLFIRNLQDKDSKMRRERSPITLTFYEVYALFIVVLALCVICPFMSTFHAILFYRHYFIKSFKVNNCLCWEKT